MQIHETMTDLSAVRDMDAVTRLLGNREVGAEMDLKELTGFDPADLPSLFRWLSKGGKMVQRLDLSKNKIADARVWEPLRGVSTRRG